MKNKKILISGASIAGPTLAWWLVKYGFQPTIVERSSTLRLGGQGVDIRGMAADVFEKMGILEKVKAQAVITKDIKFCRLDGKKLSSINLDAVKTKSSRDEVEILRGELATILYQQTRSDVEYIFADSIIELIQKNEQVEVTFRSGKKENYDLVIGADGIHSGVRKLAFGSEDNFIRYKSHYIAFARCTKSLGSKGDITIFNVPGKLAAFYSAMNKDTDQAYFIFRSKDQIKYDYHDINEQKNILKKQFTGISTIIDQLIESAVKDNDLYFDTLSQVVMASWSNGRICLTGDAAWCASPLSGAGASLSVVGTYLLAGELYKASGDYKTAFRNYESLFKPIVERTQKQLFTSLLVPETKGGIWFRNKLTNLPFLGTLASLENKFAKHKEEKLPEY